MASFAVPLRRVPRVVRFSAGVVIALMAVLLAHLAGTPAVNAAGYSYDAPPVLSQPVAPASPSVSVSTTPTMGSSLATLAGLTDLPMFGSAARSSSRFVTATEDLPTLEIDAGRMPNIARNVQSVLDEGQPGVLNRITDPGQIASNRAAATSGFSGPGSPDEYPFASTAQGGAGARVAGVLLAEQRIQGGVLSQFYARNGIGDGDPFAVKVTGLEP